MKHTAPSERSMSARSARQAGGRGGRGGPCDWSREVGGEVREVMGGRIPWASEAFVKLWLFTLSEMGNSVRFQAEEGHPFGCVVKKSETKTLIGIIQVKHDGVWDRGGRLKIIKLTFVGFKLQHETMAGIECIANTLLRWVFPASIWDG